MRLAISFTRAPARRRRYPREIFPQAWLAFLAEAVDEAMAATGPHAEGHATGAGAEAGRFGTLNTYWRCATGANRFALPHAVSSSTPFWWSPEKLSR